MRSYTMKNYIAFLMMISGGFQLYGAQPKDITLNSLLHEAISSEEDDFNVDQDSSDSDSDNVFGIDLKAANNAADEDPADQGDPLLGGLLNLFLAQQGIDESQFGAFGVEDIIRKGVSYVPSIALPSAKNLGYGVVGLGEKAIGLGATMGIIGETDAAQLKVKLGGVGTIFSEGGIRPNDAKTFDILLSDAYDGKSAIINEYVSMDRELLKKTNDTGYGLLQYAIFGYINGKQPVECEAIEIEREEKALTRNLTLLHKKQFATELEAKTAKKEFCDQAKTWRYHSISKTDSFICKFCKDCNKLCTTKVIANACKDCSKALSDVYFIQVLFERDNDKCLKALNERSCWKVVIDLLRAGARCTDPLTEYLKIPITDTEKNNRLIQINHVVAMAEKAAQAILEEIPDYPQDPSLIPVKKSWSFFGY